MVLKIYGLLGIQPCREVVWLCEIAEIPYEFIKVNLVPSNGDHTLKNYTQNINPIGYIPGIENTENGFTLYESAAIMQYLCHEYGLHQFYPLKNDNIQRQALINEYLYSHHENIRLISVCYVKAIMRTNIPLENLKYVIEDRPKIPKILNILENRLKKHSYVIDDQVSIADILCFEEVFQLNVWNLLYYNVNETQNENQNRFAIDYPFINKWILRMQKLPKYDEVHSILTRFTPFVKERQQIVEPFFQKQTNNLQVSKL